MLSQHLAQVAARMAGGVIGNLLGCAADHDLASFVSAFGAEID
jgi:hypothetical protein